MRRRPVAVDLPRCRARAETLATASAAPLAYTCINRRSSSANGPRGWLRMAQSVPTLSLPVPNAAEAHQIDLGQQPAGRTRAVPVHDMAALQLAHRPVSRVRILHTGVSVLVLKHLLHTGWSVGR